MFRDFSKIVIKIIKEMNTHKKLIKLQKKRKRKVRGYLLKEECLIFDDSDLLKAA